MVLKDTISSVVVLLKEIRKDVKVAAIVILTFIVAASMYLIFLLLASTQKTVEFYENKLNTEQQSHLKDLRDDKTDYRNVFLKIDSTYKKMNKK